MAVSRLTTRDILQEFKLNSLQVQKDALDSIERQLGGCVAAARRARPRAILRARGRCAHVKVRSRAPCVQGAGPAPRARADHRGRAGAPGPRRRCAPGSNGARRRRRRCTRAALPRPTSAPGNIVDADCVRSVVLEATRDASDIRSESLQVRVCVCVLPAGRARGPL
jgi:hypothetical protein